MPTMEVSGVRRMVILKCQLMSSLNLCPGDAKCLVAFMRKEGEFERYRSVPAAIVGIIDCGGCDGTRAVPSLGLLKMHLASLKEDADVVHVGTCITKFCPRKDDIVKAVRERAGVEVVEGTHKYVVERIFGK